MREFREELNRIIDEAQERGVQPLDIDEAASERLANYATEKYSKISDIFIKLFNVLFCSFVSASIYVVKVHAAYTNHKVPEDSFLNWICGVCIISAAAQFFPVERIIRTLRGKDNDHRSRTNKPRS